MRKNNTAYEELLDKAISPAYDGDGIINAHTHLDRADTLNPRYLAHIGRSPLDASKLPLTEKQALTGELHKGPAYIQEDLERRMRKYLDIMKGLGTKRVCSLIDTTADNVGLTALETALKLKDEYKDRIDFQVASYGIFGFKDSDPERWEVFEEGAKRADFLGSLPERDDNPGHIGYNEHLRRVLRLAIDLGKPIHVHVDQGNDPGEDGTERLVEAVRWLGSPVIDRELYGEDASVWAVHVISPSCYTEKRFRKLMDNLLEYNIGVICCPTAALSMRQYRPIKTYTHNSIARIPEMLLHGITVRIGSDNISDLYIPEGTPDIREEIKRAGLALRFPYPDIMSKVAKGHDLNNSDREKIRDHLKQDEEVFREISMQRFQELYDVINLPEMLRRRGISLLDEFI
jgi:cytosine/adenosine deaminase-related metal-dependent hydrolase